MNSVLEAKNYCRNLDHYEEGPWCYTKNPYREWDLCDVKICERGRCPKIQENKHFIAVWIFGASTVVKLDFPYKLQHEI